ncbi:TrbI/VirB10 family protein [Belnapia rosea]|uniref:TrbI/VirB10 family protein n=1 Tax=Belnapia rosea TaxID=938405 RepID=UPI00159FD601|nr:TrbI/VirB10 family protein [Belnapia rosea]
MAAQLRPTRLAGVRAMRRENLALIVQPGTPLSCVMQTAFDSTQPSMPVCILTRDVYGATGTVVLMERGTRLVGESRGRLQQGQARVFVMWERAITPAGVEVELASPATDALGRGGIGGDLDTQFWSRFGGALLLSLVSDGVSAGASALAGGSGGMGFMGGRTLGTGQSAASEAMRNSVNIPPVLKINQGAEIAVMVARTLDFSGVYSLGDAR